MEALLQIIPLKFEVMINAKRFVEKMEKGAEVEQQGTNRNKEKVYQHAKRCLWIIHREGTPDVMRRMLRCDTTLARIKEDVFKC